MRGRRPTPHPLALVRLVQIGTQAALAAALTARGIPTTQRAVSYWERGLAIPSEERLELLSLLMRLRPEDIDNLFWPFLRDTEGGDRRGHGAPSIGSLAAAQGRSLDGRCPAPCAVRDGRGAPALFGEADS